MGTAGLGSWEADGLNESSEKPKGRPKKLLWLGVGVTTVYLVGLCSYAYIARLKMTSLPPNEVGDFLAGAFSPLAFLWLVLGYFQQGEELKNSADALWLQGEELQNSVTQQRELVEVTREQLAHEREALAAEERRVAAAEAAMDARSARAKIEAHNGLIEQITAMGVLATAEAKSVVAAHRASYAGNSGTIMGDLSGIRLAELRNALPELRRGTSDVELLGAINALVDALQSERVVAEGGAAYAAALEARFNRIHDALLAIDGLRR